jgi:glucan-binding YG repeat protein
LNIRNKIFALTFITTLALLPATCAKADTSTGSSNYSGVDYLNSSSQSTNTAPNPGTPENKPAALNISNAIPVSNSQNPTKVEDNTPNIISTIGWKNENGSWYYYKSDNTKAIGWIKPDSSWYYLKDNDGKMVTGWLSYEGSWYYLDNSGTMCTGWKLINNKWYFFDSSGVMATGVQSDGSNLYHFTTSGTMSTTSGWININNKWYYADNNGKIETGWLKDNDNWYFLQGDGSMVTGLYNIDNKTYMFNDNGSMATGWIYINSYWYYFNAGGDMATGWTTIDGKNYYLYDTGAMATGWINLNDTWYYLNSDGSMATGWVSSNGSDYYYLDPATGKMLTNTTIDGYNIGSDGKRYTAVNLVPLSTSSKASDDNIKKISDSVNTASKKYDLDSKLILAIIKAESNFDPNATSSSGATGLMQIMPENYAYLGITNGYDINQNINGGSKLLKDYLTQFNGDLEIAVAAYNAGPKNVENDGVSSDADLCKMSQGVQDYVKEVISYYKNGILTQGGVNTI